MEILQNTAFVSHVKTQFLPSATATVATDSGITLTHVKTEGVIPPSLHKNMERDYLVTKPKIQPSNTQPLITSQNSNSDFVQELNKINQLSFFDGFNCLDLVAVSGNNLKQELRKLSVSVLQHHTLVDVFLCLSFANCLFTGELRLALALVRLWWGGDGNKSFIGRIPSAVLLRFSNLPTALSLGQPSKNLPFEKVQ